MVHLKENRFNKYRIWKPLGLLILARLTPPEWDITVVDENLRMPDYGSMPRPDLVGLTAFTSQADRAYKVAEEFRSRGVPVVMGGIHATMCLEEALDRVDAVVTGEAEEIWARVLEDARRGALRRVYSGGIADIDKVPPARHDLLPTGYAFGSIQTTRGCPLNCSYCSVTAFNGSRFRRRPIEKVIEELRLIEEKLLLVVDDNLIGTSKRHVAYAKDLFRAMIDAKIRKRWVAQVTINMADDEELLRLAAESGCFGIFVGFESLTDEGLIEVNKRFNIRKDHDPKSACRRMQRHGISVLGAFIMGLDVDKKGIGRQIANAAISYGVDTLNLTFMTPLPGTRLWETMESQGRIAANSFPEDWKYYTLGFPVASYMNLSWAEALQEFTSCLGRFYSYPRIFHRFFAGLLRNRRPVTNVGTLISNIVYRRNLHLDMEAFKEFDVRRGVPYDKKQPLEPAVVE
jgi:radical SAM superfamily enzyme YgiQ (UPF0313 family)